jgi:nitrite reductase (NADH) large subunit
MHRESIDQAAPVHSERVSTVGTKPVLVVVGNGMVGHNFCEKLAELGATDRYQVIVFGEEPRVAYDRVHLTELIATRKPEALALADGDFYSSRKIELCTGERVDSIDRDARTLITSRGRTLGYDKLVLATGSTAWVPAIPGVEARGVFVYRTIEDLEAITAYAASCKRCAVLGGGLLGLEAARAMKDLGLATHIIELAPRLMPNQLDATASKLLEREVKGQGIEIVLGQSVRSVRKSQSRDAVGGVEQQAGALESLEMSDGSMLEVEMLVISAGIRPRDDLAKKTGLTLGARGGVVVDDMLATNDPNIFAVGECALHRGKIYGLVAPGYAMADVLARRLCGEEKAFEGGDLSTKLKLLGVEVASFGDPFVEGEGIEAVAYQDFVTGVYKRLLVSKDGKKLLGGILVGDAKSFTELAYYAREAIELPGPLEDLVFTPKAGGTKKTVPDSMQVCSCHNVTKGNLRDAIAAKSLCSVDELKKCTKSGTGCGGCVAMMTDILSAEMLARGAVVNKSLCEHFAFSRQELFEIVSVNGIKTFDELLARYGQGHGCEVCKPTAAAIFASTHNEMVLDRHATLQDTNDRFLANIQRRGLYSVVPRVPGGELTPEKLIVIGQVAKKYGLYTKITGGQRIDLFGARVNQLPDIWEELVNAGFESGHAYGKALRTVKSCVGTTWCRYGVQDSVALAIRVENRYKGLRAPHKLKSAVSGCTRECAEAQSKDFGIIATERGYNLFVGGNGGMKPRHADLLATDLDEETLIKYIDRFLMFYIRTADRLQRTSVWLDKLDGGIEHLKEVVVQDKLSICADLEAQMQHLVDTYECEWAAVVRDPQKRAQFTHFVNTPAEDPTLSLVSERGQAHPAPWPKEPSNPKRKLALVNTRWVRVGRVEELPVDGGVNFKHGDVQIAVFRFASRNELYATQNMCPHKQDMVLSRGILGDHKGEPKVACPLHKKTFALKTGECLTGEPLHIRTFPVKEVSGEVFVELPPAQQLVTELCPKETSCYVDAAE